MKYLKNAMDFDDGTLGLACRLTLAEKMADVLRKNLYGPDIPESSQAKFFI